MINHGSCVLHVLLPQGGFINRPRQHVQTHTTAT